MWTAAVPTRALSPPTTRGCVVADYDKASIQTWRYGPHGEPDSGGSPDRLGYAGGVDVAELGLVIMGARVYSPAMGRFLQTDPIGIAGGANVYDYAGGDPVNGVDPSGLASRPAYCNLTTYTRQAVPVPSGQGANEAFISHVSSAMTGNATIMALVRVGKAR